jgi:hypothetical protein
MVAMPSIGKTFVYVALPLILLLSAAGSAVSIQPAKIEISYVPGQVTQYSFYVGDSPRIESYVAGELAQYATLFDPLNRTGPRHITVTLRLPPDGVLEPGRRVLLVGARELPTEDNEGIGALAAVQAPIYVEVPFPGLYLTMNMDLADGDINSIIPVAISTVNKGTQAASDVKAMLEIFQNGTEQKMFSLLSAGRELAPGAGASFRFNIDTTGWSVGEYRAEGKLLYEGGQKERQGMIRLGTLGLRIVDFSQALRPEAISPFYIEVASTGSVPLENVFGEFALAGKTVRTSPADVPGWQRVNLTGYFDTAGLKEGTYTATATAHYAGKTAQLAKEVAITNVQQAAAEQPIALPVSITAGSSLIIGLVLVILGLLFLIMRRRHEAVYV